MIGDELKRVNWRASAHLDDLVVRQEERPKTGRVTVLLDRRAEGYDEDGFERAVSAALSALHSGFRGGDALRFLTTAGPAVSDIRTRSELDAVDEQLALIDTTQSASLVRSMEELNRISGVARWWSSPARSTNRSRRWWPGPGRTFGLVVVISCMRTPDETWPWAITYDEATDLTGEWRLAVTSSKGSANR